MASSTIAEPRLRVTSSFSSMWDRLTTPHAYLTDGNSRRRARLISGLGLVLSLALFVGTLAAFNRGLAFQIQLLSAFFMLGIYGLSRTQHFILAGTLMLAIAATPSITFFIGSSSLSENAPVYAGAIWLALPIVIGGLILPVRGASVVNGFIISSFLFTKLFLAPNLDSAQFWNSFAFLTVLSLVMTFTLKIREAYLIRPQIDELIRANKVKDEFLATMSHELRTPLNAVIGYSSILLDGFGGEIDDEARTLVSNIAGSGDQLLSLITDILDISKIEAGKVQLDFQDAPLDSLCTSWKQSFEPLARDKGIEFELELASNLPKSIQTDPARLTQIVTNLLTNAIKFTHEGRILMRIIRQHNELVLMVQDTGIGIPENQQDAIFDKFKQVDSSASRKYEGTGLGLAITQRLVQLFGGDIQVTSQVNEGATFTVTLPLIQKINYETIRYERNETNVKYSA